MKRQQLLHNLGLSLCTTMILFVVLEIAVRAVGYDLNEHPRPRYHRQFGWTLDPQWKGLDNINELGFRFHPVPFEKPDGVKRLLILGDSFAQDSALPFSATLAGFLETLLNRETTPPNERWQVINLGIGGWGTAQELIALRELGLKYQPDIVVLQIFPYNDLCNNNLLQAYTCATDDFHRPYFVIDNGKLKQTSVSDWRTAARSHSKFFGLVENRLLFTIGSHGSLVRGPQRERMPRRLMWFQKQAERAGLKMRGEHYSVVGEDHQPPQIRAGWQVTEKMLAEIASLLKSRNIPLLGVVIPFELTFEEEFEALVKTLIDPPPLEADYANARFENILRQLATPVVSVRDEILASDMGIRDYFSPNGNRGDRHLNRYGNYIVSLAILERLQELRWIGRRDLPSGHLETVDVLSDIAMPVVRMGWRLRNNENGQPQHFGTGSQTTLAFSAEGDHQIVLEFDLKALAHLQTVQLILNNVETASLDLTRESGRNWQGRFEFLSRPGRNEIRWRFTGDLPQGQMTRRVLFQALQLESR